MNSTNAYTTQQNTLSSQNISSTENNKFEFIEPTYSNGSCVSVKFNQTNQFYFVLYSTSEVVSIESDPQNMSVSSIKNYNNSENIWSVSLSWLLIDPKFKETHLFCFQAKNKQGYKTEKRCVSLVVDGIIPKFANPYPTGLTDKNISYFSILSQNVPIIKSNKQNFYIRIFDSNEKQIYNIEANSSDIWINNSTQLVFRTKYNFTEGETYFVRLDPDIVRSNQDCPLGSLPLNDKNFWSFSIKANHEIKNNTDSIQTNYTTVEQKTTINTTLNSTNAYTTPILKSASNKSSDFLIPLIAGVAAGVALLL